MQHLILGGTRSGKSRFAETLASASHKHVVYIATASIGDSEMATRICQHQARRPAHWSLLEEPIQLADALQQMDDPAHCLLVDCLTLWMTNLLLSPEQLLAEQCQRLLKTLPVLQADLLLVSNESNLGITPMDSLTRRYCDEMGLLHQALAQQCDQVSLIVAGLATRLKG